MCSMQTAIELGPTLRDGGELNPFAWACAVS
jgi:hypothetical protein